MSKSETTKPKVDPALARFDELPDSARVRVRVVAALEGCCPATVWRRVSLRLMPRPEKVGNTTVWRINDLRKMWSERSAEALPG